MDPEKNEELLAEYFLHDECSHGSYTVIDVDHDSDAVDAHGRLLVMNTLNLCLQWLAMVAD